MKRFFALLLCLTLLMSVTACKKNKDEDSTPTTTTTGEAYDPTYALDPVINRFFTEFIDQYGKDIMDVQSIHRGPGTASTKPEDLTKEYIATINGLTVTLRNASYVANPNTDEAFDVYQLRVIIEGGTTVKSRDAMMQVFSLIARTVDPGCTTEMADTAIEQMEKMTETGECRVSSYVKVENYTPIIEEYGVPTKIEMLAINYVPLEK